MTAYFIRRFLLIIPTFIGITLMVFAITRFVPGGPIERMIAQAQQFQVEGGGGGSAAAAGVQRQPLSDEQIAFLKQYYGFDKPLLNSYVSWLGKVLQGDLGVSTRYHDPVWEMIRTRIPISLYFGLITMFFTYGVCIPLGIVKAIRHQTVFDNASSIIVFIGYAIPGWVIGIVALITALLAIPMITMAPSESASTEPSGPVFDARDAIGEQPVTLVRGVFDADFPNCCAIVFLGFEPFE